MSVAIASRVLLLAVVALAVACGGTASVSVAPSAPPTTTASPTTAAPAGLAWTVSDKSKATVRVHEQLVGVSLPSDAVLVATGAKGGFTLNADGSFSADSKITFDLTSLKSDATNRDNFVKQDTLATRQFPIATFVPTKATGIPLPLPATADMKFRLSGTLTIHGKEKPVTFAVVATRNGADLTVTATVDPALKFGDFGMSVPSAPLRVVSVTDEIILVVDLVATGPRG
jgi:polyisoprenoid-binding protein YceI